LRGGATDKQLTRDIEYINDATFKKLVEIEECHQSFQGILDSFRDRGKQNISLINLTL
jgi:hypothetical protein